MKIYKIFAVQIIIALAIISPNLALAQTTIKGNPVITRVGDPKEPRPVIQGTRGTAPNVSDEQLRQALIDQFGLSFVGFDPKHMRWAWDKMWEVSGTNFIKLIHGSAPVIRIDVGSGQQLNCAQIIVGQYGDEQLFKLVLTHELGHVIYHCNGQKNEVDGRFDHDNLFGKKRSLTKYGSTHFTENYAEMIAYYLNPGVFERTHKDYTNGNIPFANGNNSDFFAIAQRILGAF